jgi:hypothetical protein
LVEPLFFFGAGASRPFDIPTMKGMVSDFQKELASGSGSGLRSEVRMYSQVAVSLRQAFGKVDLESVFTVVDAIAQGKTLKDLGYFATFLSKDRRSASLLRPPLREDQQTAQRLKAKFEGYVKRVCWVKPDKLSSIMATYLAFFSEVFRVTGGNTSQFTHDGAVYNYNQFWEFFTTNYDNVLEVLWRSGIRQTALNSGSQYDSASASEIWNSQMLSQQNLRLIKLHGSVTWWREETTGRIVEKDQPPDATYLARKFGAQIILYPIQQKDAFVPPYFDMFYVLRQALAETRKWIVIGYSFGDEIIRSMFARASLPSTTLILVHPDNQAAKPLESEPGWSGKIKQVKTKFGEPVTNKSVAQALSSADSV